jgi:ribosomal protein L40E
MKLELINCPACNSPIDKELIRPNQPFNCPACHSAIVLTDWTTSGQLICSSCGAVNPGSAKFCDECKSALQSGCPFCYTLNSMDAVYCQHCGADLQKAWGRQYVFLTTKEQYDADRKLQLERTARDEKDYLTRLLLQLKEPENHPAAIPIIRIYGREAVEPLIELLHSDDPDARFGAAHVLGDIGDRRAIPALTEALRDQEETVRFWALNSLGQFRAEEAVDSIAELLGDRGQSNGIRELARDVLIQIGSEKALQVLRQESKPAWWPPFI